MSKRSHSDSVLDSPFRGVTLRSALSKFSSDEFVEMEKPLSKEERKTLAQLILDERLTKGADSTTLIVALAVLYSDLMLLLEEIEESVFEDSQDVDTEEDL